MKKCKECNKQINPSAIQCIYCGGNRFEEVTSVEIPIHSNNLNPSNGEISPNLLNLIDIALSDGELTEKEKQVLFKKAEQEGVDLDEFEMILDSKLKLLQQGKPSLNNSYTQFPPPPPPVSFANPTPVANSNSYAQLESLIDIGLKDGEINELERQTIFEKGLSLGISNNEISMILTSKIDEKNKLMSQSSAPKSDKFGDVKKCPSCGAIAQSFHIKCTDCGHEFSNIGANVSIGKLFEMLNACENERKDEGMSVGKAFGSLFANALAGVGDIDKILEKKKSIISGFPIPNTKDDILEFLSLAIPNAKQKGNFFTKENPENKSHNDLAPTWKSKCEQIIMKAKFSMKDDKKTLEEIMVYANEIGIK